MDDIELNYILDRTEWIFKSNKDSKFSVFSFSDLIQLLVEGDVYDNNNDDGNEEEKNVKL